MPVYTFKGTNRAGATIAGERTATNRAELQAALRREQITATMITEKGKEFALPKFGGGVGAKDLAIFTRQFSVMIDAGLPLVQCLEILGGQQENKAFQRALMSVRQAVEGGSTLANALRQQPKVFDDLYTNMIEAGETGGILDAILQRLSGHIEKDVKLKRAVVSAAIYPSATLGIAGGVILLLLWKVVPIFGTLFTGLGVELPLPTRIVIGASNFVVRYIIFGIIGGVGGFFGIRQWYQTPVGRFFIDSLLLKVPLVGVLLKKIAVARFTRTLGTMITSGVPILEGLTICARTSGNAVIEQAIMKVRKGIEEGRTMVEPLRESAIFPGMVTQMIGVGEQTGALDAMLSKVADFYEEEVDAAVKDLLTAMEPLMIVFLGVVVGGIVISLYLPLFTLIGKLSG